MSTLEGNESVSEVKDGPHVEAVKHPRQIVWGNVMFFIVFHLTGIYGLFCLPKSHTLTLIFAFCHLYTGATGLTVGAHRLFCHRSFKAKLPLRILLAIFHSSTATTSLIFWTRDHRLHHKYTNTDADRSNAERGFFFSHIGWLMVRSHPEVKKKGKNISLADLYDDPVCAFQHKYYKHSVILFVFILPVLVPCYFWGENLKNAFFVCVALRTLSVHHIGYSINSFAHLWGNKPYDKHISATENPIYSLITFGDGFHNYHHAFPSDYSTSEFGWILNVNTFFIDFMALIGQAYDRKKTSPDAILRKKMQTGDGTELWGFTYSRKKDS